MDSSRATSCLLGQAAILISNPLGQHLEFPGAVATTVPSFLSFHCSALENMKYMLFPCLGHRPSCMLSLRVASRVREFTEEADCLVREMAFAGYHRWAVISALWLWKRCTLYTSSVASGSPSHEPVPRASYPLLLNVSVLSKQTTKLEVFPPSLRAVKVENLKVSWVHPWSCWGTRHIRCFPELSWCCSVHTHCLMPHGNVNGVSQPRLPAAVGTSLLQWVANFSMLQNHLEGLLPHGCLDPHPQSLQFRGPGWGVKFFISNNSEDAAAAGLGPHLKNHWFVSSSSLSPGDCTARWSWISMHMCRCTQGSRMWGYSPLLKEFIMEWINGGKSMLTLKVGILWKQ